MPNPTVSIIVPVYNAENTLARCVESALAQTFSDLEIILVNDGSKDESGELCDAYARQYRHIQTVHRENGGESAARNTGIKYASGRYIQHLDSDDFLEPDATQTLVDAMDSSGAGLVVCSFYRVTGDERLPVKLGIEGYQKPYRQLMEFAYGLPDALLRFGASWNKLYRRDVMGDLRFEETKRANEDAHFNFAYIQRIENAFFVDRPLCNYVIPDGRSTATTAYRPQAFEMNERIYQSIENAIGGKLNARERSVFNRHYIDKTLIVLKMLCRPNATFTGDELYQRVCAIINHEKVRTALDDCWPQGTQENRAVEWLRAREYEKLFDYAIEGGKNLY